MLWSPKISFWSVKKHQQADIKVIITKSIKSLKVYTKAELKDLAL